MFSSTTLRPPHPPSIPLPCSKNNGIERTNDGEDDDDGDGGGNGGGVSFHELATKRGVVETWTKETIREIKRKSGDNTQNTPDLEKCPKIAKPKVISFSKIILGL